ncbi:MAG: cellulase family glycosylhydrolase [Bacteroidetes bacterium]|nr:cellulase family glycosylhydrolase [Bacteroidota bacterium]
MKPFLLLGFLILSLAPLMNAGEVPFKRGVNLSQWLQEPTARQVQFSKFTKKDFQNIKSLGCDVIRLPINMHGMTSGAPDYTIDPLLFDFLDAAVDWSEELGLHIILDNHSFDPAVSTSPLIGSTLVPVWKQMAQHFKDRSSLVYYEILNEPHGISDAVWNIIQRNVLDSIRTIDKKHTIIIGPAGWNSYANLDAMPDYPDTNLIYTFHFYDPFIFTHQGASWAEPSLVPLAGVPFPYDAARMPSVPPALAGTYIAGELSNYQNNGTAAKIQNTLNIAVNFKNTRNVRIFCGEFGVYKPNSMNDDRVRWYQVVRSYLEQKGIAWTSWDYQGGFGLFKSNTSELFDYDLNTPLLTAMGLTVPPQSIFTVRPDSIQTFLYSDFIGSSITKSGYTSGILDFYAAGGQFNGKYCIRWKDAVQYDQIGFDFVPNKDLSQFLDRNFMLYFFVKSSSPGLSFEVRFIDTKTGPLDHPWRMGATVNSLSVPWNGEWKLVIIPLKDMKELGSWDSTWFNPAGKFDWKSVDRFEIVAEQGSLAGKELWLDDIKISNPPTSAAVRTEIPAQFGLSQNYPNPFNPSTTIRFDVPQSLHVTVRIFNVLGQNVATLVDGPIEAGSHSAHWTADVSAGIYLCRMESGTFNQTIKLLLVK